MNTCLKTALVTCLVAGSASAMPAALDRVPADALVAVGITNVKQLKTDMDAFVALLPQRPDQFDQLDEVLNLDGVKADGSMAFAMMAPGEGEEPGEDNLVLIAPVADYAAFVTGLGGQAEGISEVDAFGRTMYVKDAGGGYAIISPLAELTETFDAAAGKTAAHLALIGPTGEGVADANDVFVMANIQALAPMIEEGMEESFDQAEQMAEMAGAQAEQMKAAINMGEEMLKGFVRDGQAGVMGFDFGTHGVTVDVAANFKAGSQSAGFFAAKGAAAKHFSKLPATNFFFAGAYDTSAPGLKNLMTEIFDATKAMAPQGGDWSWMTQANGSAYVMGATANLMGGGLFSNTYLFIDAKDPAAVKDGMHKALVAANGQTNQGMTTTTSYTENVATLAGVSVDGWGMKLAPDASNPAAAQVQQAMMMIYGPAGGPSGLVGTVDSGVVMTMTDNQGAMTLALQAAKGEGSNLGANATMKAIDDRVPEGASMVGYIGVGSILETVSQFMMMMGGAQFDVPADMPPIGFAAVTDGGAVHLRVIGDAATIKGVSDIASAMMPEPAEPEGGEEPRF